MSERFDIFDIADQSIRHIGVKAREAVHRDGDWHQVFHCWVVGDDGQGQFAVLQKRADDKDLFPGKLDISVGGHLEAGERICDGVREIEEELGLNVAFEDLIPLGRRLGVARYGNLIDCQICHVFLFRCDQPLSAYDYDKCEISGLLKLPLEAGIPLLAGEIAEVAVEAVGFARTRVRISGDDFIPSLDQYSLKALILARRYFAGETHLWI